MTYIAEERDMAIKAVIDGLRVGTPLTVICAADGMPGYTTIWEWQQADAKLSEAIARAREEGFDQIALDAMAIADESSSDTRIGKDGQETPDTEWISRSRLRVETRLKLLAKWDPKRYGEKLQHTGEGGGPVLVDWTTRAAQAKAAE